MRRTRVDIVVATFNASEFMKKCFTALKRSTKWPYTLTIADDCSDEKALHDYLHALQASRQARVLFSKVRRGFAGNNNWAVAQTNAPYICLLNEDTEPCYLWLTYMMDLMRSDPKIGIVGAMLLYSAEKVGKAVAGTIQHFGVARYPDGAPYHPYRGLRADSKFTREIKEVNAVTGACMLIRRKLWDELGGFDERYSMGNFEDCSLCWTARKKGWRIMVHPKARLFHYEHGCGEEHVREGHDKNRALLLEEWGHLGSDEHLFPMK